jgi:hypothetical protein
VCAWNYIGLLVKKQSQLTFITSWLWDCNHDNLRSSSRATVLILENPFLAYQAFRISTWKLVHSIMILNTLSLSWYAKPNNPNSHKACTNRFLRFHLVLGIWKTAQSKNHQFWVFQTPHINFSKCSHEVLNVFPTCSPIFSMSSPKIFPIAPHYIW